MKRIILVFMLCVFIIGCTRESIDSAEQPAPGKGNVIQSSKPLIKSSTPQTPTVSKGTLLMQITDKQPELNITSLSVTISKIEVHKAAEGLGHNCTEKNASYEVCENKTKTNPVNKTKECKNQTKVIENCNDNSALYEAGWSTVISENKTFDLIQIKGVNEILGSSELDAGRYTQIRLSVVNANLMINNTKQTLKIPSEKIKQQT